MFCTIWYHLYNLENVKNTHGGISLLVKLQAYITHGNIRSNVNPDLSIVTIFCLFVESIGVIKKMKQILLTEKEMIFLVLSYLHALLKIIILDGCSSRFLNCANGIKSRIKPLVVKLFSMQCSNKRICCVSNNPKFVNPFLTI